MEEFTRDGLVFDVSDSVADVESGSRVAGAVGSPGDSGEVVVLLHGWPQDRQTWSQVTPLLVDAGLRVVAFDQRGYSPRARPGGARAYRMEELVGDVLALLDALGSPRAHLVGHDWGGSVAWAFAERHPGAAAQPHRAVDAAPPRDRVGHAPRRPGPAQLVHGGLPAPRRP